MSISSEKIKSEINWFNDQIEQLKNNISEWLNDIGYQVKMDEIEITLTEELSGVYSTKQINFTLNNSIKFSIKPIAIWIVGARGRVDIVGPSGKEKLVHLFAGGPGLDVQVKTIDGETIDDNYYQDFHNVISEDWYWYDDSSYRKVEQISKEIMQPILERIQ